MIFFIILLIFHGLPIYILRDVFYTMRSFAKRIHDFSKYRDATRDMNARYPDATVEDLERENTCIICREEMRPWQENEGQQAAQGYQDQRYRPKKLPCGHTLHFSCLRSWLERQQVCPICRRSVLVSDATQEGQRGQAPANQQQQPQPPRNEMPPGQQPPAPADGQGAPQPQANDPNRPNLRVFQLGPLRLAFGAGPEHQLQNMLHRFQNPALQPQPQAAANNPPPAATGQAAADTTQASFSTTVQNPPRTNSMGGTQMQLNAIEQRLRLEQEQLRAIEERLIRLQRMNLDVNRRRAAVEAGIASTSIGQGFTISPNQPRMGPGDPNLPPGVVVPEGWSLLPLRRMPENTTAAPTGLNVTGLPGYPGMASAPISRRVSHERLASGSSVNFNAAGIPGQPSTGLHPPSGLSMASSTPQPPPMERQGRSPSPAPPRPTATQAQPTPTISHQPAAPRGPAASLSTSPSWSFIHTPNEASGPAHGTDGESSDEKPDEQDKGKGKARAATVEDEHEEEEDDDDEEEAEEEDEDDDDDEDDSD
jgi:E3 ubiquitin-protein ligase synoviolin